MRRLTVLACRRGKAVGLTAALTRPGEGFRVIVIVVCLALDIFNVNRMINVVNLSLDALDWCLASHAMGFGISAGMSTHN
jgi:hypothetical protein